MNDSYDVVVLGGGNAGLGAAGVARAAGRSVLVAEARDLGGTCPLRGCVPKKVLVAATEVLEHITRGADLGVSVGAVEVDWSRVIDRQRDILSGTSEALEAGLARQGTDYAHAAGRFVAPDAVAIGDAIVRAQHVVIATGSKPRALTIEGAELLTSSDELLELRRAPRSMVFVGAGVIAFELGHVFARLGTQVTLLEVAPRPLGPLDVDAVGQLVAATRALGIVVETGVTIARIGAHEGGVAVDYTVGGEARQLVIERAAHGAGRVADLDALDLAAGGVTTERGGVVTGRPFQSASNPRVFVAGDALVGTPQLSPIATFEGRLAGRALLGEDVSADYASMPSCVFSLPVLASVGLTEAAALAAKRTVNVKRQDLTTWRSARSYGERFAWAKVLVDEDDKLVGAHLLGHGAAETINTLGLAMRHGIRAAELRDFVWAYPTFSSDLKYVV